MSTSINPATGRIVAPISIGDLATDLGVAPEVVTEAADWHARQLGAASANL